MVLAKYLSLVVTLIFLLNGCEIISVNTTDSPELIPAQETHPQSSPDQSQDDHLKHQGNQSQDNQQATEVEEEAETGKVNSDLPATSIVATLLEKTQKALSLQQWLRAQRYLEQAVRISPYDAAIFMLYGHLYEHLGVPEQATNMYRRALHLAEKRSDIYQRASTKLETLTLKAEHSEK